MENFDNFGEETRRLLEGSDAFLCCLGTRVKVGEELFTKVDQTYPTEFAKLGKEMNVPYYGLLSSMGANSNSMLLYMRTKGRCQEACVQVGVKNLTIFQPGLLLNRRNDERIGEKIGSWVPFISKIEARDMGRAMLEHAIRKVHEMRIGKDQKEGISHERQNEVTVEYLDNKQIRNYLQEVLAAQEKEPKI